MRGAGERLAQPLGERIHRKAIGEPVPKPWAQSNARPVNHAGLLPPL